MNRLVLFALALVAAALATQTPAPFWELGQNPIRPDMATGKVDVVATSQNHTPCG